MYIDNEQPGIPNQTPAASEVIECLMIVAGLSGHSLESERFHQARYRLYDLSVTTIGHRAVALLLNDPGIRALRSLAFERASLAGECEEQAIASSLLKQPDLSFSSLYHGYYGPTYRLFVEDDLGLINGISASVGRVGYVGGGALPIPALILARDYKVAVTCIERHTQNAIKAAELIQRLGLEDLVTVVNSSGEQADYEGLTTVICANWIFGRKQVFNQICRATSVKQILLRSARSDTVSPLVNDLVAVEELATPHCRFVGASAMREGTSLHSLLFVK